MQDFKLQKFSSYESYRDIQTAANKRKINRQMVRAPQIKSMAEHINKTIPDVRFGICHGTRRGGEQAWFEKFLNRKTTQSKAEVIGTEISDTATDFANTVQWDFHELNEDWVDKADFIYSNSWDHSYDPERLFSTWIKTLRVGGLMLLHHGAAYEPDQASEMDPFGARQSFLIKQIPLWASNAAKYVEKIERHEGDRFDFEILIFRRIE